MLISASTEKSSQVRLAAFVSKTTMQPGSSTKQTRWKAAVAVVSYALLLRCGLMDLQERLLTLGCEFSPSSCRPKPRALTRPLPLSGPESQPQACFMQSSSAHTSC